MARRVGCAGSGWVAATRLPRCARNDKGKSARDAKGTGAGDDKCNGAGDDSLDASGYASGLVSGSRLLNFPNSPDAIIRAMI